MLVFVPYFSTLKKKKRKVPLTNTCKIKNDGEATVYAYSMLQYLKNKVELSLHLVTVTRSPTPNSRRLVDFLRTTKSKHSQ